MSIVSCTKINLQHGFVTVEQAKTIFLQLGTHLGTKVTIAITPQELDELIEGLQKAQKSLG